MAQNRNDTIVLALKRRKADDSIYINRGMVMSIVAEGDADALYDFIKEAIGEDQHIHDAVWLKTIMNWAPKKGLSVVEMAKWIDVAKAVQDIDHEEEGEIEISRDDANLIMERLRNDDFSLRAFSLQFIEFVKEFELASGLSVDGKK